MRRRAARLAAATAAACLLGAGALGCGDGPAGAGVTAPAAPAATPAPPPAAATAPAAPDEVSVGIVADTPDGRATATVPAGGTATLAFRVVNAADTQRGFVLTAADRAPGEGFAPAVEGTPSRGVGAWLAPPARVVVPPRQSLAVEVALRVPAGAAPGVHEGALVARADGGTAAGAGADVSYRAAARVTVVVR